MIRSKSLLVCLTALCLALSGCVTLIRGATFPVKVVTTAKEARARALPGGEWVTGDPLVVQVDPSAGHIILEVAATGYISGTAGVFDLGNLAGAYGWTVLATFGNVPTLFVGMFLDMFYFQSTFSRNEVVSLELEPDPVYLEQQRRAEQDRLEQERQAQWAREQPERERRAREHEERLARERAERAEAEARYQAEQQAREEAEREQLEARITERLARIDALVSDLGKASEVLESELQRRMREPQ